MSAPEWWSQPFPPDGGTTSDGLRKQLGMPELDPLTIMLRESAQNSWDARQDESKPVEVRYRAGQLAEPQAQAWRKLLLPFDTADPMLGSFPEHLATGTPYLLVSDRNTTGLGGPLRSNVVASEGEDSDFVNFVRNAGEPRDRALGGGTFGFGKGALFRVSRAGVLIIDTVCQHQGRTERRLIAAALGASHDDDGIRHTGRHWWGTIVDNVPDPLVHADADRAASELGLLQRNDGTGTDIWIIGADFGETDEGTPRTQLGAARLLASSAAWHLWPKLVSRSGRPPELKVTIESDEGPMPVPDPSNSRQLRPFVEALQAVDEGRGTIHTRTTAPQRIGEMAVRIGIWNASGPSMLDDAAPFHGRPHHCARMRQVELVVDYMPGPEPDDVLQHYGAVYRASAEADEYFKAAEPPTHHDWIPNHLTGTAKGVVTGARRFIQTQLLDKVAGTTPSGQGSPVPLGSLSKTLAKVLPLGAGDGASGQSGGGGGGGGGSGGGAGLVRTVGPATVDVREGVVYVKQRVRFASSNTQISAVARALVGVDGGTEREAPEGAAMPTIAGWEPADNDGRALHDRAELTVSDSDPRDWVVLVKPVADTATVIKVAERRAGP